MLIQSDDCICLCSCLKVFVCRVHHYSKSPLVGSTYRRIMTRHRSNMTRHRSIMTKYISIMTKTKINWKTCFTEILRLNKLSTLRLSLLFCRTSLVCGQARQTVEAWPTKWPCCVVWRWWLQNTHPRKLEEHHLNPVHIVYCLSTVFD